MEPLEQEIYDIWAEFQPVLAFRHGANQKAGAFFNPTEENINKILRKIDELKVETIDSVNLGLFNCLKTTINLFIYTYSKVNLVESYI